MMVLASLALAEETPPEPASGDFAEPLPTLSDRLEQFRQ